MQPVRHDQQVVHIHLDLGDVVALLVELRAGITRIEEKLDAAGGGNDAALTARIEALTAENEANKARLQAVLPQPAP